MPLRILQINTADAGGGAASLATALARGCRARGCAVGMAVGRRTTRDANVVSIPDDRGLGLRLLGYSAVQSGLRHLAGRFPRRGWGLASRTLRLATHPGALVDRSRGLEDFHYPGTYDVLDDAAERFDIVHCHNLHGGYFDLRALSTISRRMPTIWTLHDAWALSGHCAHSLGCERWRTGCGECPDLHLYPEVRRDATSENWQRKREIYAASRLYVATPSRWLMSKVQASMLGEHLLGLQVIPNGVDLSVFRPVEKRAVRRALGIPLEASVVLVLAGGLRQGSWMDHKTLRDAVAKITATAGSRRPIFVALGDPATDRAVDEADVRYVGYQTSPAMVAAYHQAADLYLHAAKVDTFPTMILEALACGTPVVACAVGGVPEQIRSAPVAGASRDGAGRSDTATGVLVPAGDADAMASATGVLLSDVEARCRIARNAVRDATDRFDIRIQVDRYLAWYRAILAEKGTAARQLEVNGANVTAPRSLLRRAAAHLPDRTQLLLKQARVAALPGDDWAAHVAGVRERERHDIERIVSANRARPGRQRVLIVTLQQSPPWLDVSCGLAAALELRGHSVRSMLCDGLLPVCERNLGNETRPPCGVCAGWLQRYVDGFGIGFARLTELISASDRDQAAAEVAELPDSALEGWAVDGVPVGRLARRELQRHRRGYVFEPTRDAAYRSWLTSGVMLARLAARVIDRERPDLLIASSGRTLLAECLTRAARARGVRVVTWDTQPSHADGLVFSHGSPAVQVPLDDEWMRAQHEPLTSVEREALHDFVRRWAKSETTPFPYNPDPVESEADIRSSLALRSSAPLIVAFTNSAWDMKAVDRDLGFTSMFDWLFALVEYGIAHPELDLVIRAHPAEVKTPPDLQSRTPVVAEVRRRYGALPGNIKLIDGASRISSYTLARMADIAAVYSSRIGLEIALMGKRPWVAGDVTYRAKGFTRDLTSPEDMLRRLDDRAFNESLSDDQVALAERFAYLWFFRYVTRLPLLRPADGRFRVNSFSVLAPGGDPVVDRVCDALINGTSFVDLNKTIHAATAYQPA